MPMNDVRRSRMRTLWTVSRRIAARAVAVVMLAAGAIPSEARSEDLSGSATLYAWLPAIDSTVTSRSGDGELETSISASDIIDALNFAFMAAGEVHYGRFGLLVDTIYSDIGDSGNTSGPLASKVKVDTELLLVTAALGYQVYAEDGKLIEPYAGARYIDIGTDVTVKGGGPLEINRSADAEVDWWDPVIGVRGRLPLTESLAANGFVDIGGFGVGSEFTWEIFAGLNYAITERWSADAGFRYLSIDYESSKADVEMEQYGPVLGLTMRF